MKKCQYCTLHNLDGTISALDGHCATCGKRLHEETPLRLSTKPPCSPASTSYQGRLLAPDDYGNMPTEESGLSLDATLNSSISDQLQALRAARSQNRELEDRVLDLEEELHKQETRTSGMQHHIDELERVNLILAERMRMEQSQQRGLVKMNTAAPAFAKNNAPGRELTLAELQAMADSYKARNNGSDLKFTVDQLMDPGSHIFSF
jgi:hypothetical protein